MRRPSDGSQAGGQAAGAGWAAKGFPRARPQRPGGQAGGHGAAVLPDAPNVAAWGVGVSHRLAASKEAGASSGAEGCNGASFWWGEEGSLAQGLVLELEKWRIFPEPPTLMGGKSGCQLLPGQSLGPGPSKEPAKAT